MPSGEEPPRIRPARPEDAPTLVAFNCALARETEGRELDRERVGRGVRALFEDASRGTYWVAERGGEVVGALLVTREWSDWRDGEFWWIQSVWVREETRGRGVFGTLYRHVAELARSSPSVCGLRLYVERENERAQRTYAALGMRPTGYRLFEDDFVLETR